MSCCARTAGKGASPWSVHPKEAKAAGGQKRFVHSMCTQLAASMDWDAYSESDLYFNLVQASCTQIRRHPDSDRWSSILSELLINTHGQCRSRSGVPLSHDEASCRIQAAIRGFITRQRIKKDSEDELIFVGMKPKVCSV
eukprot:1151490-Pelagomonas_calceolata.AAC.6